MTIPPDDARKRLLNHLSGIAGYNDKGRLWSRHSPQEVEANQAQAQAFIMQMVSEIGEQAFSLDLLHKLRSGAASRDESGDIHVQAQAELAPSNGAS